VEKYENTRFNLNKELHSLSGLIEEVKSGQEIYLKDKNLKMNLFFQNQKDFLVMAEKDIIVRVFDNLLANAIRFSPLNSSIEFVAGKSDDDSINISIKNHGEPIPDESLPYIFDKYWHSEKTDSSSHRSTGLGLTFCKMAIEAHGYAIAAQNATDGIVFTFSLHGIISSAQAPEKKNENPEIIITKEEEKLLKPYFDRLQNLDVNQVSDILQVLTEIPEQSTNLTAIKQQIRDAAFASNNEFYRKMIGAA
jgi:K+-sensing histidine kinase KdpD